mmetsp:Transcript_34848/g.53502  ORF Transcript_34848/g.53502 Transcript_34848/m.53502 type:complete len:175 (+) Transcript_34848:3068-3592(+)
MTLVKEADDATRLIILENGTAEVMTYFDGNPFVIDRLFRGSIINFRHFLSQEIVPVTYKCQDIVFTLEIDTAQINFMIDNDPEFTKQYRVYLNRLYRKEKMDPLDYIYGIPENQDLPEGLLVYPDIRGTLRRESIFKNLVFKIIQDKRELARRPKLGEILKIFAPSEGEERSSV